MLDVLMEASIAVGIAFLVGVFAFGLWELGEGIHDEDWTRGPRGWDDE